MPDNRDSLVSERRHRLIWLARRRVAPAAIALGGAGTLVGILTSQPVAIVALDVIVMLIGGVIVLILRWGS